MLKLAQDPGGLILGQKTDGWFWAPGRRQLPTAKLGIAPALLVPAVAPSRHRVLACGLIDPYTPRRGRGRSPPTARGPRRSPQERRRLSPRPPRPARRSVVPAPPVHPLSETAGLVGEGRLVVSMSSIAPRPFPARTASRTDPCHLPVNFWPGRGRPRLAIAAAPADASSYRRAEAAADLLLVYVE